MTFIVTHVEIKKKPCWKSIHNSDVMLKVFDALMAILGVVIYDNEVQVCRDQEGLTRGICCGYGLSDFNSIK